MMNSNPWPEQPGEFDERRNPEIWIESGTLAKLRQLEENRGISIDDLLRRMIDSETRLPAGAEMLRGRPGC